MTEESHEHHQLDILGLIAGFIGAKLVNREGQGFWLDIVLGIIGALVGGFLFALFGASGVTGLDIYSMIVAIVGSVVVLLIYNALTGRRRVNAPTKIATTNQGRKQWLVLKIRSTPLLQVAALPSR